MNAISRLVLIAAVAVATVTGQSIVRSTGQSPSATDCKDMTNCPKSSGVVLILPRDKTVECGTDWRSTAAGAGAAFAMDDCNSCTIKEKDVFSSGKQKCPESMRIRRTFTATDRCNHSASGTQTIDVVDSKPPRVRARLVALPPLAVGASQITLTPKQTELLVLALIELAKLGAAGGLLDSKLGMFGGLTGNPLSQLTGLVNGNPGASMQSVFGTDGAALLSSAGFDLDTVRRFLNSGDGNGNFNGNFNGNNNSGDNNGNINGNGDGNMNGNDVDINGNRRSGNTNSNSNSGGSNNGAFNGNFNGNNNRGENNGNANGNLNGNLNGNDVDINGNKRQAATTTAGSTGGATNFNGIFRDGGPFDPRSGAPTVGAPLLRVVNPNDGNNGVFGDFLKSGVALPIGVQACSNPSTRVFYVNCTASDNCSPGRRLRAAAQLRVTHITNRNRIGAQNLFADPMLKGKPILMRNHMGMLDMHHNQRAVRVNRPVTTVMRGDGTSWSGAQWSGGDGSRNGNFDGNFNGNVNSGDGNGNFNGNLDGNLNGNDVRVNPKAATDGSANGNADGNFNGNGNSGDENGNFNGNKDGNLNGNDISIDIPKGGDAIDLSRLPPSGQSDFNTMDSVRRGNSNNNGGNANGNFDGNFNGNGNSGDRNGNFNGNVNGNGNGNDARANAGGNNNNFVRDPLNGGLNRGADQNQVRQFLGSSDFADATTGTSVLASQCATAVSYVPLHCGDVVSITLDAEDACLAENFGNDHPFMIDHTFRDTDFKGGRNSLRNVFGSDQDWVGRTSYDAIAVRGTDVELQVLAEDECGNVGRATSNPTEQCDAFVSGRCCPVIANGISQFARNQVLSNAPAVHGMINPPPVQLSDVLNSKLHIGGGGDLLGNGGLMNLGGNMNGPRP